MSFTAALHTYFSISAIGNVAVSGLDGVTYTDSLQGGQRVQQSGDVTFDQEVDRIYLAVPESGVQVRFYSSNTAIAAKAWCIIRQLSASRFQDAGGWGWF
jgi:D-hexose-6-phosphate mutarotase